MGSGIGSRASRNVCRVSRYGPAGVELATTAATRGSAPAARIAPMPPMEWPEIAATVTSGLAIAARNAASESAPNSPALSGRSSGGFAPWARTSNVRQWNPAALRKSAIGSVRSRADSQPWTSTTAGPGAPPRAGMNQAGRSSPSLSTVRDSYARPRSRGVTFGTFRRGYPARTRYASANRYASPSWAAAMAAAKPARRMVPTTSRGRQTGQPVKWCLRAAPSDHPAPVAG